MNYTLVKKFPFRVLWVLFLISGAWSSSSVFGQPPVIKTSVDKMEILIGQPIRFRAEISFPQNQYQVKWFSLPDYMDSFEVVSREEIDSATRGGVNTFGQTFILTNFDSGRRTIPALAFTISSPADGKEFTMYTDSVSVEVKFSPSDNVLPFHDIKSIIEIKDQWPWWVWVFSIAGILILIVLINYLIQRYNKRKALTGEENPKVPPYDEAVLLLDALIKEELIEKGYIKDFHLRLSNIFKRYLSRKLQSDKMHFTTEEVLIELREAGLPGEEIGTLANALHLGNAVKFARFMPSDVQSGRCLQEVRSVITGFEQFLNKKEFDAR